MSTHPTKSKRLKSVTLYLSGLALATIPPILAIITYFPLWRERSTASLLSGGTLLLVMIASVPLYKVLKEHLSSPSAPTVWVLIFISFYTVRSIVDEMVVISFVGLVSNLIASLFFKAAKKRKADDEN